MTGRKHSRQEEEGNREGRELDILTDRETERSEVERYQGEYRKKKTHTHEERQEENILI